MSWARALAPGDLCRQVPLCVLILFWTTCGSAWLRCCRLLPSGANPGKLRVSDVGPGSAPGHPVCTSNGRGLARCCDRVRGLLRDDGVAPTAELNRAGVWPRLHAALPAELRRADLLDLDDCVVDGSHLRALKGGPRRTLTRRLDVLVLLSHPALFVPRLPRPRPCRRTRWAPQSDGLPPLTCNEIQHLFNRARRPTRPQPGPPTRLVTLATSPPGPIPGQPLSTTSSSGMKIAVYSCGIRPFGPSSRRLAR